MVYGDSWGHSRAGGNREERDSQPSTARGHARQWTLQAREPHAPVSCLGVGWRPRGASRQGRSGSADPLMRGAQAAPPPPVCAQHCSSSCRCQPSTGPGDVEAAVHLQGLSRCETSAAGRTGALRVAARARRTEDARIPRSSPSEQPFSPFR